MKMMAIRILHNTQGGTRLLEFLNLVTDFKSNTTIKIPSNIISANKTIPQKDRILIIDTGADKTAIAKEVLRKNGYEFFEKSGINKNTASGVAEFFTCTINGIIIANQFKFGLMKVDVLENWKSQTVVGVIGMDILTKMTFILSHEYGKFLLTDHKIPEIGNLFHKTI